MASRCSRYLEHLLENRGELSATVHAHMKEFETALAFGSSDGALRHAARNFALVYAGGRIAIDAGLLPWDPEKLLAAVKDCFDDAMQALRRHESLASRARKILIDRLKAAKLPLKGNDQIDPAQHAGFREQRDGQIIFTINAAKMRAWFPDAVHFRAALEWLDSQELLIKVHSTSKPDGRGTEWAVRSPRWVGAKKVKSIRFRAPEGIA